MEKQSFSTNRRAKPGFETLSIGFPLGKEITAIYVSCDILYSSVMKKPDRISTRPKPLNNQRLAKACKTLAANHSEMRIVLEKHGVPPLWDRPEGFATLLHIILEQQVSLASARACFDKLKAHIGEPEPEVFLTLDEIELRKIGFSRQKTSYARHLSEAMIEGRLDLTSLSLLPDAEVKAELIKLKGIGEWTSDIYLLMAMLRPDVMPKGDIALHAAWHKLSGEPKPSSDAFIVIAEQWKPFRSAAARLLWHFYLSERSETVRLRPLSPKTP